MSARIREYIGNVTSNRERQIASDPAREKMRLDLLRKSRWDKAERDVQNYRAEIMGEKDHSKAILEAFDTDGRPPVHITAESLNAQYKKFHGQLQWITAILEEFHLKLEQLDPDRYAAYQAERGRRSEERKIKKEEAFAQYTADRKQQLSPKLRDMVGRALQKTIRAKELSTYVKKSTEAEMHLVGSHQIGVSLGYLFADYIRDRKPLFAVTDQTRYEAIENETARLELVKAEVENKLVYLKELTQSAETYLNGY
jgi:hypothetical protein